MNKIYCLILLVIPFFGFREDCNVEFEYKAIKNRNNQFSIELVQTKGPSADYNLELHDLYTDELISKRTMNFNRGDRKVVFENIKGSSYTIYFSSTACNTKKSIKGKAIVLY